MILTNYGLAEEKQYREQKKFKEGNRFQSVDFDKRLKWLYTHDYGLAESEGEKSVVEANKVS